MTASSRTPAKSNSEQKIFEVALELFAQRGYAATGIRHISDAAGITSAALYYYARTKDELLLKILRSGLEDLLRSAEASCEELTDPVERIRRLVAVHVEFGAKDPQRARVIDNELQWLADHDRRSIVELRDAYERLWSNAIADGIESAAFTVDNPSLARLALLEMCNGLAHWYRSDGTESLEAIVIAFQRMALAALGARPDRAAKRAPSTRKRTSATPAAAKARARNPREVH